jgi:hypothetical protein
MQSIFARGSLVTICFADKFGMLNWLFEISPLCAEDAKDERFIPRCPLIIQHCVARSGLDDM